MKFIWIYQIKPVRSWFRSSEFRTDRGEDNGGVDYSLVDARDIAVQHHAPGLFCNHYLPDDPRITTDCSRCDRQ